MEEFRKIKDGDRLLTVAEVAEVLGCGKTNAYNLCHAKGFPALRVGAGKGRGGIRVRYSALMDWLKKLEAEGLCS